MRCGKGHALIIREVGNGDPFKRDRYSRRPYAHDRRMPHWARRSGLGGI